MDRENKRKIRFAGFQKPNNTPVPDEFFDELLHLLTGAEAKVVMYIIRRTFGFKKHQDNISLKQMVSGIITREGKVLDHGTGLSKDSVSRAVKSLEELGAIVRNRNRSREKGDQPTTYSLNTIDPVSENRTPPSTKIGQGRVRKSDTQETVVQGKYVNVSNDTPKTGEWSPVASPALAPLSSNGTENGQNGKVEMTDLMDRHHVMEEIFRVFPNERAKKISVNFYRKVVARLPRDKVLSVLKVTNYDTLIDPSSKGTAKNPAAIFTNRLKELAVSQGIQL